MRHNRHYLRALLLLLGGGALLLLIRGFLIPKSFNEYGFYRGDNVEEQMNKPTRFAAKEACAACHEDIWKKHQKGSHAKVQCQNCHAPLSVHVNLETGDFVDKMPINKSSKLCLRCHLQLPSRPKTQPQIDVETHISRTAPTAPPRSDEVCLTCHTPHDPKIKRQHGM